MEINTHIRLFILELISVTHNTLRLLSSTKHTWRPKTLEAEAEFAIASFIGVSHWILGVFFTNSYPDAKKRSNENSREGFLSWLWVPVNARVATRKKPLHSSGNLVSRAFANLQKVMMWFLKFQDLGPVSIVQGCILLDLFYV